MFTLYYSLCFYTVLLLFFICFYTVLFFICFYIILLFFICFYTVIFFICFYTVILFVICFHTVLLFFICIYIVLFVVDGLLPYARKYALRVCASVYRNEFIDLSSLPGSIPFLDPFSEISHSRLTPSQRPNTLLGRLTPPYPTGCGLCASVDRMNFAFLLEILKVRLNCLSVSFYVLGCFWVFQRDHLREVYDLHPLKVVSHHNVKLVEVAVCVP
ncbi:uncharacterized protein NEMAJ01_2211 [Nematocida major]|uniref:uncharacterized protein n=1 Tax=Nematocida major TaxID=1912982 RepID=UPI00200894F2|nr:uncharacterized protein NEMAJ01_2211 [Nematocida major]KAH9387315.1 hypothetical protein NEMAJ01_2211 [Nematocida major]